MTTEPSQNTRRGDSITASAAPTNENDIANALWRIHVAQEKLQSCDTTIELDEAFNELTELSRRHIEAFYQLGVCYYRGLTPERQPNYRKAYDCFTRLAIQGEKLLLAQPDQGVLRSYVARAQYCTGEMLAAGKHGSTADATKALKFFKAAAKKGDRVAQHTLAHHFQHARGDIVRALEYYEQSAKQGYGMACAALGGLVLDHIDTVIQIRSVSRDRVVQDAIHWLNLAADQASYTFDLLVAKEISFLLPHDDAIFRGFPIDPYFF